MSRQIQMMCAWSGLAFSVLYGLAFVVIARFIPPPSPSWSAARIDALFIDHAMSIRIGLVLSIIVVTSLFLFYFHLGADRPDRTLRATGRNPADVRIGLVTSVLVHDDEAIIDAALDNLIARWIAAVVGRINPADWRKEGIEPAPPEGWIYFMKYAPYLTDPSFVDDVLATTTRQMAEKAMLHGTPEQVAAQIGKYCDAGVDYVCLCDFTFVVLEPADAANQLGRLIAVCAALKARSPHEPTHA